MGAEFWGDIVSGGAIAIVTAFLTVRLSLKQFRSEHLWERKIEAYERIIEALHNSKSYSLRCLARLDSGIVASTGADEKARERVSQAVDEIAKVANVGGFLLTKEAVDRLKKYNKEEDDLAKKEKSAERYFDADLAATSSCLDDLIGLAKKDLQK